MFPAWCIPETYTQLEYLESTGTQYIDTGVYVDDTYGYYIDAQKTQRGDRIAIGVKGSDNSRWTYNVSEGNVVLGWNDLYVAQGSEHCDKERHVAYMNYLNSRQRILDGVTRDSIRQTLSSNAGTYSVPVFAGKWGSDIVDYYWIGRIYAVKISRGSDIIRDFIPVRRISDGVLGMYDTVSNTFFTNAGIGTFIAGPDKRCSTGYYLPANMISCVICPVNSYCGGGAYTFDETEDQGIVPCPNSLYSPMGSSSVAQCGRILHIGEDVVYLRSVKKTTPSLNIKIGDDIFYGNMTTSDTVMHNGATNKLKIRFNDIIYSVYDDTVNISE